MLPWEDYIPGRPTSAAGARDNAGNTGKGCPFLLPVLLFPLVASDSPPKSLQAYAHNYDKYVMGISQIT